MDEGEYLSIDGTTGEVVRGEVATTEGEAAARADDGPGVGRRDPGGTPRGAGQRRHRGRRRPGPGVGRRGHRALPDRAPVPRRPPALGPAHDPGRDRGGRGRRPRGAREPSSGPTSRRCSRPWTGCPVTVRLLDPPLHEFLPDLDELIAGEARGELDAEQRRAAGRGPASGASRTRCWACGGSAWRCSGRGSTAPRSGPCSTPPRPGCGGGHADRRGHDPTGRGPGGAGPRPLVGRGGAGGPRAGATPGRSTSAR